MAFESVLVGSGLIYIAPVGTTFPVVNAAPSGSWQLLGNIDGGVTVNVNQKIDFHRVDAESGPVKATRSEEDEMVVANLAEATLENLAYALYGNAADIVVAGGPPATKQLPTYRGVGVQIERAILFRGTSPYGAFNAQFQLPRGVHSGNVGMAFTKDSKVLVPVEFTALVDPNAPSAKFKFGSWIAQTA